MTGHEEDMTVHDEPRANHPLFRHLVPRRIHFHREKGRIDCVGAEVLTVV